jgi:hypothetical protein
MFYTPDIHKRMSRQAFLHVLDGCPQDITDVAIYWSSEYDRAPNSQDVENSHTHAMTPMYIHEENNGRAEGTRIVIRYGSKFEAFVKWSAFIWENITKCEPKFLGYALHAAQDAHAHGHSAFEYWGGGIPSLNHIWHDVIPDAQDEYEGVVHSEGIIKLYLARCRACCGGQ